MGQAYERLAPSFGYETRTETREFDPKSANGRLMIAVCKEVLEAERKRAAGLVEAAKESRMHDQTIAMIRREGFVFDNSGGRWEKLAFTLYTDICAIDSRLKEALQAYHDKEQEMRG